MVAAEKPRPAAGLRDSEAPEAGAAPAGPACPVDHTAYSHRKTVRADAPPPGPAVARGDDGVWRVRAFEEARQILRGPNTKQAGFRAEVIQKLPGNRRQPILYLEGQAHLQQRKQTARFFTPTATSANYRGLMESLSDEIVAGLQQSRRADLSQLSMHLAVQVASRVVGLTNSRLSGMHRRLDAFFANDITDYGLSPRGIIGFLRAQWHVMGFYLADVQPAIAARRRQPSADVISHLIEQNYKWDEILIECVTYAAAGMVTTREFISVAAWHFLEHPDLRQRYLAAGEAERHQMLNETLRLEPVVAHLYRRATGDVQIESAGQKVTIPAGDLIDLNIYDTNADESVVGQDALSICPGRKIQADRASAAMLSFGDGHHRCPGAYIAIQETDIFLQRLLALDGLRIIQPPSVTWNELAESYELRGFILGLDAPA